MKFNSLPTPPDLFRQFEAGEISREELQATMALHARDLIEEMVEVRRNPVAAYLEQLRNQAAARKLVRRHGGSELREIFSALGSIPAFPPAQLLWNASHAQVPLHCFIRMRREPVFRIIQLEIQPMKASLRVEYGENARNRTTREKIILSRDARLCWELQERKSL